MAQQLKLPDGRSLDYAVYGSENGFPFIYHHGTPSGYLPSPEVKLACEKKGLKLITFSRAGSGGSSRKKGRQVVDVVADVHALNRHLGVERCIVGGWSGGGPHSLACAARLPGCTAALCVASVAPYDAEGLDFLAGQGQDNIDEFGAALQGEEPLQKFCAQMREGMLSSMTVDGIIETLSTLLPPIDREALLSSREMGQHLVDTMHEALKVSCDGWVDDDMAFIKPWGFELGEIKVPVLIYQGTEDKMVPIAHGEWLAGHLPQDMIRKHIMPGQGHLSISIGQGEKILGELVEAANA